MKIPAIQQTCYRQYYQREYGITKPESFECKNLELSNNFYYPQGISFGLEGAPAMKKLFSYGLPCIYTGIEMIDAQVVTKMLKNFVHRLPAVDVCRYLDPFINSLMDIEKNVYLAIKEQAELEPHKNIKEIMQSLRDNYEYELIKNQMPLFKALASLGYSLPDDLRLQLNQLLTETENKVMDEYMARGGNLFVLTDVGRQEAANPLLARFGLKMEEGILAQPIGDFTPDLVLSKFSDGVASIGRFGASIKSNYQVSMPECVALDTLEQANGFTRIPLLETREADAWIELETDDLKENEVVCNETAGEKKQRYVTAYLAERKVNGKNQRIIVCGDADCLSNAEIYMQRDGYRSGNATLIAEGFHWLTDGNFPVDVSKEAPIDTRFNTTSDRFNSVKHIFSIIIPGLLLILGVFLWVKRHKR